MFAMEVHEDKTQYGIAMGARAVIWPLYINCSAPPDRALASLTPGGLLRVGYLGSSDVSQASRICVEEEKVPTCQRKKLARCKAEGIETAATHDSLL